MFLWMVPVSIRQFPGRWKKPPNVSLHVFDHNWVSASDRLMLSLNPAGARLLSVAAHVPRTKAPPQESPWSSPQSAEDIGWQRERTYRSCQNWVTGTLVTGHGWAGAEGQMGSGQGRLEGRPGETQPWTWEAVGGGISWGGRWGLGSPHTCLSVRTLLVWRLGSHCHRVLDKILMNCRVSGSMCLVPGVTRRDSDKGCSGLAVCLGWGWGGTAPALHWVWLKALAAWSMGGFLPITLLCQLLQ